MAYANHQFCWHGVITPDTAKVTAFYPEVLGWQAQTVPMGEGEVTVFATPSAGPILHTSPPAMDGVPSQWQGYLRVEDVDAAASAAQEHGGKVLVGPKDIDPGRFALVAAPSGATFCLFHEADAEAKNAGEGEGNVHWNELQTQDFEADVAFLTGAFGFTTESMEVPHGQYVILKSGDTACGGVTTAPADGPSRWLTWIQVSDVDATATRVKSNGGQLLGDVWEMPGVGRMVAAQDPAGATFGIITPAAR